MALWLRVLIGIGVVGCLSMGMGLLAGLCMRSGLRDYEGDER